MAPTDVGELVQRFATAPTTDGLDRLVAANEEAARRSAPRVAFTSPTVASGFDPSYVLTGRVDVLGGVGMLFVNGQPVTPAPQPRLSHESTVQLVGANLQITKDEVLGSC